MRHFFRKFFAPLALTVTLTHSVCAQSSPLTASVTSSGMSITLTVHNSLKPSTATSLLAAQASLVCVGTAPGAHTSQSPVVRVRRVAVSSLLTPHYSLPPLPAAITYLGTEGTVVWDQAHRTYVVTGLLPPIDGGASESRTFLFALAPLPASAATVSF